MREVPTPWWRWIMEGNAMLDEHETLHVPLLSLREESPVPHECLFINRPWFSFLEILVIESYLEYLACADDRVPHCPSHTNTMQHVSMLGLMLGPPPNKIRTGSRTCPLSCFRKDDFDASWPCPVLLSREGGPKAPPLPGIRKCLLICLKPVRRACHYVSF